MGKGVIFEANFRLILLAHEGDLTNSAYYGSLSTEENKMARTRVEYTDRFLSLPQVMKRLGKSRFWIMLRIERGVLPKPTFVDMTSRVTYFSEAWIERARGILNGKDAS